MTRSSGLIAIATLLAACGTTRPGPQQIAEGHQPGEEAAVVEALNRYVTAISMTDLQAMAAMQTPDGMTYQWRSAEGGGMHITAWPNSYWIDPSQDDGHAYRERYWLPTVMIRGGIAVVWAPYEFWIDGATSHCGVDVFDFVKTDGQWRVSNAMWTVEPDACNELRPAEPSNLRPVGGPE